MASSVQTVSRPDDVDFFYDPELALNPLVNVGWKASPEDAEPFFLVHFKHRVKVSCFQIDPFRIGKLKIEFSLDGTTWEQYKDPEDFSPAKVCNFYSSIPVQITTR